MVITHFTLLDAVAEEDIAASLERYLDRLLPSVPQKLAAGAN
jgi:hypothetical protein